MDDLPKSPEPPSTIDRREMLRKSAFVGGGLVWGVPLIKSVRFDGVVGSQPRAITCCSCECGDAETFDCRQDIASEGACREHCASFCEPFGGSVGVTFQDSCPTNTVLLCGPKGCFCGD